MRQLGSIANEPDAQRFAAFLVASGIDAHAEEEQGKWAIWVRDENQLDKARAELTQFVENPRDARYQDAERAAAARRGEQERQRQQAQKNVVQMRGRWGRPGAVSRRAPLTIAMIILSVFVALASGLGEALPPVASQLTFAWPFVQPAGEHGFVLADGWAQLRQGQLWRAITPIFIHFGITHLIFNMIWLYYLGSQIEDRLGTWKLAVMVLVIAALSNMAQNVWAGPAFGGMSGVGYGLFGFVWMRMMYDRGSGFYISAFNVVIMLVWFVLCVAREFGPFREALKPIVEDVANTAHGVGLVVGLAMGYLPVALRSRR